MSFGFLPSSLSALLFTMDDKWPPVKECPQYKYGMINQFLQPAEWESRDHIDDSEFPTSDEEEDVVVKNAFQIVKRFLKQVRNTRGYEVDCRPPGFYSTFMPLNARHWLAENDPGDDSLKKTAEFVVENISEKTKKTYNLESIERIVFTGNRMYLYTIKAKEDAPDADVQTFYAMVYVPGDGGLELKELLVKPNYDAPTV